MSDKIDIKKAAESLLQAENVLILCHKNPDGDTIGSGGALCHALKSLGKKAAVLCADEFSDRYAYAEIELYKEQFQPQYIVAVDVADLQLFGEKISEYTKSIDLCIDHHPSNTGYAHEMILSPESAATAEVMYDIICEMQVPITTVIADCLYTGVSTDTGCFRFANTTARTHEVAQKLMEHGANATELNALLFENKSKSRIGIERVALDSLEYLYDGKCAVISLTLEQMDEIGVEPTDLEGITAIPRAIEGVEVGVTLRQQKVGTYKVSVRTKRGVSAANICKGLGGGGHEQAAGCEVEGSLQSAKAAVMCEIEKAMKSKSSK